MAQLFSNGAMNFGDICWRLWTAMCVRMIVVIVVKVILVINIKRKHRLIKDKGNTYAHVHIYIYRGIYYKRAVSMVKKPPLLRPLFPRRVAVPWRLTCCTQRGQWSVGKILWIWVKGIQRMSARWCWIVSQADLHINDTNIGFMTDVVNGAYIPTRNWRAPQGQADQLYLDLRISE
jgi:hypothetical protein